MILTPKPGVKVCIQVMTIITAIAIPRSPHSVALWFAAIQMFSAKIIQPDAAAFGQSGSLFQSSEPDNSLYVVLFSYSSEECLMWHNRDGEVLLLTHL